MYFLAWLLLNTNYEIYVHHVDLVNREGRSTAERNAINRSMAALKKIRSFKGDDSGINDMARTWIPLDMTSVLFQAGKIVREHFKLSTLFTHIAIGTCIEEGHNEERWPHMLKALESHLWLEDGLIPCPELMLPEMVSKQEEIDFLEKHGISYWSCRTPINGSECGKCHVCKTLGKDNIMEKNYIISKKLRDDVLTIIAHITNSPVKAGDLINVVGALQGLKEEQIEPAQKEPQPESPQPIEGQPQA